MKRRKKKSLAKNPRKVRNPQQVKGSNKKDVKSRRYKHIPADPTNPLEKALALMKKGVTQAAAAKNYGVSEQRLARYRRATTTSKWKARKWIIKDRRPVEMYIAEKGKLSSIVVRNSTKGIIGRYWNDVNEFLSDNDPSHLKPYVGNNVRDINRKIHVFETGPNTLRMLDAMGELGFVTVYANTAQ